MPFKLSHPVALGVGGFVAGVALFTAMPSPVSEAQQAPQPAASYQLPQA